MNNSINTEKIMSRIRRELNGKIPDFEDIPYKKPSGTEIPANPDKAIRNAGAYSYVHPYRLFTGNKFKILIKKSIRKVLDFYIVPLTEEQNNFNASTVSALTSMRNTQKKLIERIEKLEQENKRLIQDLYGE
ncbi:MAG: hypothetical protein K2G36_00600 [Ruminococcus sp.]|nr:hypothetical protein [Ruminococcus sp.]